MLKRILFIFLFFTTISPLFAQNFKVQGRITDSKLEPLPFVSIQVKGAQFGILSKEDGSYEIALSNGTYQLVLTMIGYKSQVISLVIDKDVEQNIIMEEDDNMNLSEVIIKTKAKDRSEEVMRRLIQQKDSIQSAAGSYSSRAYIKAIQQDSGSKKILQKMQH